MTQNQSQLGEKQDYSLDSFILRNQIGSGSFGKVYKVEEKKTNKIYAAKISIKSIEDETEEQKNIFREVNIISKLDHPSILKFIYYSPINFKRKPKPVIITEFAPNGSLGDLISNQRNSNSKDSFSLTHKLIIIYRIACAMSYIHSNNIIHRDLKPDNILLDKFLLPKIADFGLSKSKQDQSTISPGIKGTPLYMSPEIWKRNEYSEKSDVYAFSLILYEILTNENLFESQNFFQIIANINNKVRPEFKKPLPTSYQNLIEKCWSENPADRPTFDEIVQLLKTDRGFITDSIDEKEFLKFINFIDNDDDDNEASSFVFNSQTNNSIKLIDNFSKICPYDVFIKFNEECQKLIKDAENNLENQFNVSILLIEGQEPFQRNVRLGLKYLKNSMNEGFIKSLIFYCKLLIKGSIIPKDHKKVRKIINTQIKEEDICSLLLGKLFKDENNFNEAKKYFQKSIELENIEAVYEYAKIIFPSNKEESIKYYQKAVNEYQYLPAMYKLGKILIY